jgi:hypothetical protein
MTRRENDVIYHAFFSQFLLEKSGKGNLEISISGVKCNRATFAL